MRRRCEADTVISWVRSHIGIPGNENADKRATFESLLGDTVGAPNIATREGVRAFSRSIGRKERQEPGFGHRRTEWGRHALSAYTWLRTNRGPQRNWLHHLGQRESPSAAAALRERTHTTSPLPVPDSEGKGPPYSRARPHGKNWTHRIGEGREKTHTTPSKYI